MNDLECEAKRFIPIYHRKTFEHALEDADGRRTEWRRRIREDWPRTFSEEEFASDVRGTEEALGDAERQLEDAKRELEDAERQRNEQRTNEERQRALTEEEIARRVRREDGKKGGRPRGVDPLQSLIEEIVAKKPDITPAGLLSRLEDLKHEGVIEDVTARKIHFKTTDGRGREAPISGLKSRLVRARNSVKRDSAAGVPKSVRANPTLIKTFC